MDHNTLKERDTLVDLESGEGSGYEDDTINDPLLSNKRAKHTFGRLKNEILRLDGTGSSSEYICENLEFPIDKNLGETVEKNAREKCKKASKPPRPPKGPLLDSTDMKMVKEISELATKKRARIERMKAKKKSRAAKSSSLSNSSSLYALIVTLLFCLVIIFQGIYSRNNSSVSFQGSPEPAAANAMISVQLFNTNSFGPSSESPNFVEHNSGSEFRSPG